MKAASVAEMRNIDAQAASRYGISELVLMENAGRAAAEVALQECHGGKAPHIVIVAGHGNNGGDGFVAARHLLAAGAAVEVYFVGQAAKLKAASRTNYDILLNMGAAVVNIVPEQAEELLFSQLERAFERADCVLDSLLGTGLRLPLRELSLRIIELINRHAARVVAVDVPSGIDADTGAVGPEAVRAAVTVTFGLPKQGMLFYPAADYCGRIITNPIGLPRDLLNDGNIKQFLIDNNIVRTIIGRRSNTVHKGFCGRVAVIAGSVGLTGAAALASLAALRNGAGLVTLGTPQSLQQLLTIKLTEVMTKPLPEQDGALSAAALQPMLELAAGADAVLLGPGLGRCPATCRAVREFLHLTDKPVVIDADALFALNGNLAQLRQMKTAPILTPHIGEMAALCGKSAATISASMTAYARQAAEEAQAVVVLKSARTVVAYPDGAVYINTKGNAGMATGGSGDVLAGAIAALLAEKKTSLAAVAGVAIHAAAGDIAAENGMEGLIAGDILASLPQARAHIRG